MEIDCLIVDDEQLARKLLGDYLDKIPGIRCVGSCKNALQAMGILQKKKVDLILLDIQMPDLKGTDFLRSLPQPPEVILTTAYPDYALEGFELSVLDYLLKPISFQRFVLAINKARESLSLKRGQSGTTGSEQNGPEQYLSVKADHRVHRIPLADIRYIEGLREYVTFYLVEKKIIVLESLKNLEASLPSTDFMRVHKSYIVNKRKVGALYGNRLELGDAEIPIGKSYKEQVLREMFGG